MDDPVLNSYLNEFQKNFGLEDIEKTRSFEYFSAYCILHRDFSEHARLEDAVIGGEKDTGIDSFAALLNEIPVTSRAQVDEILKAQRIDADFVFIQSKTSRSLKAAEIGSYLQGVKEFFGQRFMPANEDIADKRDVADYIFEKSVKMRERPRLHLFYAYAGNYKADQNIVARVEAAKKEISDFNLFSEIDFTFLDSDALQKRYQEVNLRIEREVQINEYASLPPIEGIRQAYLGVLPGLELVKLLSNSDGGLHKALFNENVRDFLDRNPVNDEIASTITSKEKQDRLAALNNGVTIVAREMRIVGKRFTLADYQIVNGCQTSHILFNNKESLSPDTSIPVKIIEAENRELVNEIVRATNRQTEVKDEAFVVLGDFHKRLERFFASVDLGANPIVYERRKRQYADTGYTQANIVTLTLVTNAFVSSIIENPVDANDYYGVLLKRYGNRLFVNEHSLWPYLYSSLLLKDIERRCVGKSRHVLWKFRYIIALLVRRSFGPIPELSNDAKQKAYGQKIISLCQDADSMDKRILEGEIKIAKLLGERTGMDHRNAHQDREFVRALLIANPA